MMVCCWIISLDHELDVCVVVECPLKFTFAQKSAIFAILYGKTENPPKFTIFQRLQTHQYNLDDSSKLDMGSMNAILSSRFFENF